MKKFLVRIILICIFLFVGIQSVGAYYNPGTPTGFVSDYTGTLSDDQIQQLDGKLTQFEQGSGNEISVVMISGLDGDSIENFAEQLFTEWGIGKKEADNGVLVLVVKDDHKMRIEVGYGLEGVLTDAQSSWIINQTMKPAFQVGDFNRGLSEAVDRIVSATKGEVVPSTQQNEKSKYNWSYIIYVVFFVIMWLVSVMGRSKSWWLGGVIGGAIGLFVGILKGFMLVGFISMAVLVPLGLLFDFIVSKQYTKSKARGHVPWWIGGGRGGGGGGFEGFGGGMSGGGGSSGSW